MSMCFRFQYFRLAADSHMSSKTDNGHNLERKGNSSEQTVRRRREIYRRGVPFVQSTEIFFVERNSSSPITRNPPICGQCGPKENPFVSQFKELQEVFLPYRVVQQNFTPEMKYFICSWIDLFLL